MAGLWLLDYKGDVDAVIGAQVEAVEVRWFAGGVGLEPSGVGRFTST